MLCRWALAEEQNAKANRCSRALAHLKRKLLLKSVLAWGQARCIEAETRHAVHKAQRSHQRASQVSQFTVLRFPLKPTLHVLLNFNFQGNSLSMLLMHCQPKEAHSGSLITGEGPSVVASIL